MTCAMPSATSRKSFGSVSPRYTEIMTPPSCVMSCDRARNTALSSSISLRAFAYSARSVSFSAATERAVASEACRSEDARFSASSALRNSSRNREASARSTNTSASALTCAFAADAEAFRAMASRMMASRTLRSASLMAPSAVTIAAGLVVICSVQNSSFCRYK